MGNCNCFRSRSESVGVSTGSEQEQAGVSIRFEQEQAGVSSPTRRPFMNITDFNKIDVNQLTHFIEFIDHQLFTIKKLQKAPSTSSSTLLDPVKKHVNNESVNRGIKFVYGFIEKTSNEVEELQKTGVTQEMGSVAVEVTKVVGQSHWVLLGLSLVAFALERANQVSSNVSDCIELLESMTDLAKIVQRLNHTIPEEADKLNKAVQVLVEGAFICCDYISKGKGSRYWTATVTKEQLEKTRRSIQQANQSIDQMVGVTNLETTKKLEKQITRREEESPHKLLEIEPVGISEQVEKVKGLLEMEGSSPSVAVILYGFGGVGKSTLAKSVIDTLKMTNYKFCRVVVDAENPNKTAHIVQLQTDILFALVEEKMHVANPDQGRQKISAALENKCSFIFIDNIVEEGYVNQLLPKKMSGEKRKMRILITSRTNAVRQELKIDSDCIKDYSVDRLSDEMAMDLLRTTVRGECSHTSPPDFDDEDVEINAIAKACYGVPLLLDTYGRFLKEDRSKEAYKYALDSLQKGNFQSCSDTDLGRQILYVCDKMEDEAKEAFLDICVFFYGWKWDLVASVVGEMMLRKLINRALVKKNVKKNNWGDFEDEVIVHDVLRLMGRNKAAGTRLQGIEELSRVLEKGGEAITNVKGIWLLDNESPFNFKFKDLEAMHESLRVLALGNCTMLDGECRKTFYNLRFLQVGNVDTFPFESTSNFENLAVIHNESMSGTRLPELPPNLKQIKSTLQRDHNWASPALPISWKNIGFLKVLEKIEIPTGELVEFPEEFVLPTCVVEVDLSTCKQLPKGFGRLTYLRKLTLQRCNKLITLPREFCELRSLKYLDLWACENLTVLPDGFGQLSSLHTLDMSRCTTLSALPDGFGQLSSLQALDMSGCTTLSALPDGFGQLSSLQTLDMSGCTTLSALPDGFGQLSSLQTLHMSGCTTLSALPDGFGQLSSLQTLHMSGCTTLSSLPNGFGQLSALQALDMYGCTTLSALPDGFGQLSSLRTLDMFGCTTLSALPDGFGQLSSLQTLHMSGCTTLSALPDGFGQLSSLQTLHMYGCTTLSALPDGFGQLSSLQALAMYGFTTLSALPDGFGQLSSLQTLDMSGCTTLSALSDGFGQLSSLQVLGMSGCTTLSALPDGFGQLSSLQTLDMSGCTTLSALPDGFGQLSSIQTLEWTTLPSPDFGHV